jgi:hypothetical protein
MVMMKLKTKAAATKGRCFGNLGIGFVVVLLF